MHSLIDHSKDFVFAYPILLASNEYLFIFNTLNPDFFVASKWYMMIREYILLVYPNIAVHTYDRTITILVGCRYPILFDRHVDLEGNAKNECNF